MDKKPTSVSIIIPCYNQCEYLEECLSSVVAQTFIDWEAIVLDDGSTIGNAFSVVEKFNDQRIRVIQHLQNRGLAAARNTGIRAARGELVVSLDADDKLAPNHLEKLCPLLLIQPQYCCAFPDFQVFGACNGVWYYQVWDAAAMTRRQWIPGSGTLMRHSLWSRIGGYCEAPELRPGNEDWDFWLSAVAMGIQVIHVPEPLYLYRRHKNSMVTRLTYYDFQTREFMYRRHRGLFERHGTGNQFRSEGYLNSARAALQRRERRRAIFWSLQATRLWPMNVVALRVLAKALTPSFLLPPLKVARKIFKALSQVAFQHLYKLHCVGSIYWNRRAKDIHEKWGRSKDDYETLGAILSSIHPSRVFDFGCGSGRLFPLYEKFGLNEIVAQDVSKSALNLARQFYDYPNIQLTSKAVTNLNYPENYFDLVICNRVLQHIHPHRIGLTIRAICRLGKFVYINELSNSDEISSNMASYIFVHDYLHLFNKYGFLVKKQGFIGKQKWFLFEQSVQKASTY